MEDVVDRDVVNELRCVLAVGGGEVVDHDSGNVLHLRFIVPQRIEYAQELLTLRRIQFLDEVERIVAALTADPDGRKLRERVITRIAAVPFHVQQTLDESVRAVGFELDFAFDPLDAFPGNGFLCELVSEFQLEVGSAQGRLPAQARDIELALFLRSMLRDESRRGEDEAERINVLQFGFELPVGVDGETCSSDGDLASLGKLFLQVVLDKLRYVVEHLHGYIPFSKKA